MGGNTGSGTGRVLETKIRYVKHGLKLKCLPTGRWKVLGHPKFRNIALTFESDPPNIPDYYNPTGCYKRKFEVPKSWKDKEIILLRFEGIKSAAYIWVNGNR
jgi:beta-galactosidase